MKHNLVGNVGLIWLFSMSLLSCGKEWIGEKSNKQQAVPLSLNDFQAILNNEALNVDNGATLIEIATPGHYTTDLDWSASSDDASLNAYTWSNERPYSHLYWTSLYSRVFNANVVLDALENFKPSSSIEQKEFDNIKGQALFHRADAFYRAAQVWAVPYSSVTADADMGIPLRIESDITVPSVRSSVKATYRQIESDLLNASSLLTADFVAKTRPYKLSAFALLARLYLCMRDYNRAGVYADSCLQMSDSLLDFNKLSTSANFIGSVNENPEVIFHISIYAPAFLSSACFIDSTLFSTYAENDLRSEVFFKRNNDGSISYKGNYGNTAFSLFGGLAIDELFLIRAESYARAGLIDLAMRDLNHLLRSRWRKIDGVTTYIDQTANSAEEALKKVIQERKKELLLRGVLWTDLRRLNFEISFSEVFTRTIGGIMYTLEPGSHRYTFPIPGEVIARSNMQQNIGW